MNLFESLNETGYNGVISLTKDNKEVFECAFGYFDKEKNILNTLESKYRIASVTKQFTALAILKLYEDKFLDLNDTLDKYIEGVTRGNEITIHQVMSNSSGIPNFSLDSDFESIIDESDFLGSLISSFKSKPLMFEPGQNFFYSISGYLILQYIIEKVSKMDYETFLKINFFEQLNMINTGLLDKDNQDKNLAKPYKNMKELARPFDMRIAGGGGGLYSDLTDLKRWCNALFNKKILNEEYHDLMFKKHIDAGNYHHYGYGMVISEKDDYFRYYHPGGGFGINTFIAYFPKTKYQYIMMSNCEDREVFTKARSIIEDYINNHQN